MDPKRFEDIKLHFGKDEWRTCEFPSCRFRVRVGIGLLLKNPVFAPGRSAALCTFAPVKTQSDLCIRFENHLEQIRIENSISIVI